jgi:hypothetical protein
MKLLITLALCGAALAGCATVPAGGYYRGSAYAYDSGPAYGYDTGRAYYDDRAYYGGPYYRGSARNYDHDSLEHGQ